MLCLQTADVTMKTSTAPAGPAVDAHLRSTYVSALNLPTVLTSAAADLGVTALTAAHDMSAHRLQTSRAFATSVLLLLGPEQRCPRITCRAAAGSTVMLDIAQVLFKRRGAAIVQQDRNVELHEERHGRMLPLQQRKHAEIKTIRN